MIHSIKLLALWVQLIQTSGVALQPFQLHLRPACSSLSAAQNGAITAPDLQIFDSAFDTSACEMLHYLAQEHCDRTNDGSSIFTRPPNNERPLTPIERAIDSALTEMGDKTQRVEYWSRDEYMNIDVHADIDEVMLESEGSVRCPLVGHVLYLQVKDGLKGPTCVFPGERTGWGLNEGNSNGDRKDMIIVPAVEGRILRFPGSAMHAVPCPANRWLLSQEAEKALRNEEENYDETDDDDDDEIAEDDDIERSVLLFNTWADDEPPPRGVCGDIATGALPEGIELDEEDAAAFLKSQEASIFSEWAEEFGKDFQHIRCTPRSQWKLVDIGEIGSGPAMDSIAISLMGRENRRLYVKQYAELKGPLSGIESALNEGSKVTLTALEVDG